MYVKDARLTALALCGSSAGGRLALLQQAKALEGEGEPSSGVLVVEAAAEQMLDAGEAPVHRALSLAPEHRRGHGALYDAVNHGQISIGRLRRSLAGLPRAADGRLVLAVDVSSWLRPGGCSATFTGAGKARLR